MEKLTHGSLFSGIGGFDLAAEWMGWENKFHCEWNEFGQKVLHHYWPEAECFTDITKSDFTKYYGKIDILTGGFPCQPYSTAGKRKGKNDERHLWPEMLRAIREISPRFVVGENVRGLTNWNGGLVFEEVCAELESYGYQVAPVIIPACAVNAPHKRERIWFVAYSESVRWNGGECQHRKEINQNKRREFCECRSERCEMGCKSERYSKEWATTNTNGAEQTNYTRANDREAEKVWRQNKGDVSREFRSNGYASNSSSRGISRYGGESENGEFQTNEFNKNNSKRQPRMDWEKFPTQSPICGGNDGLPTELDGITFPKWRSESIKAYGNAIVPQVAYQIFQAIEKTLYL